MQLDQEIGQADEKGQQSAAEVVDSASSTRVSEEIVALFKQ